jgi:hypothetical protein
MWRPLCPPNKSSTESERKALVLIELRGAGAKKRNVKGRLSLNSSLGILRGTQGPLTAIDWRRGRDTSTVVRTIIGYSLETTYRL